MCLRLGPVGAGRRRGRSGSRRVQDRVRGRSEADWIEETRAIGCSRPSSRHMLSDVPVGAFLSGGVDSGAVTPAMARTPGPGIKAFTAGFPGSKIDETAAARASPITSAASSRAADRARDCGRNLASGATPFDEPSAANSADTALVSVARRGASM